MGRIIRIATGCGLALTFVFAVSISQSQPAQAQGGIICSYGTKAYKACCKASYKSHPKLSARKRADAIDACMHPSKKAKAKSKEAPKESAKEAPKDGKETPKDKN
jgi:hypothetical protein